VISTDNPHIVAVISDSILIANFEKDEPPVIEYTLTLIAVPQGAGTLIGTGKHTENSEIQIGAIAKPGYTFTN